MPSSRRAGLIMTVAVSAVMLVLIAGPATAHIEPTPSIIKAGQTATVAFKVEHGCGTSPTTKLTFKIPPRVKNVALVAKAGWKTSHGDSTVAFEGGRLGAHTTGAWWASLAGSTPRRTPTSRRPESASA